jgi:hypothetical protein
VNRNGVSQDELRIFVTIRPQLVSKLRHAHPRQRILGIIHGNWNSMCHAGMIPAPGKAMAPDWVLTNQIIAPVWFVYLSANLT